MSQRTSGRGAAKGNPGEAHMATCSKPSTTDTAREPERIASARLHE